MYIYRMSKYNSIILYNVYNDNNNNIIYCRRNGYVSCTFDTQLKNIHQCICVCVFDVRSSQDEPTEKGIQHRMLQSRDTTPFLSVATLTRRGNPSACHPVEEGLSNVLLWLFLFLFFFFDIIRSKSVWDRRTHSHEEFSLVLLNNNNPISLHRLLYYCSSPTTKYTYYIIMVTIKTRQGPPGSSRYSCSVWPPDGDFNETEITSYYNNTLFFSFVFILLA